MNSKATNDTNVEDEPTLEDLPISHNEIVQQVENPPPTQEDIDKKQQLIFKIQKYQDSARFGNIVKNQLKFNQTYDELTDMPIENLDNMLARIRIHLDNKNLDKFYDSMLTSMCLTYEQLVSLVYDIDGFTDILLDDNETFMNCWERFKIENNFPAVNPTTQMLFMIGQATIMAHHLEPRPTDTIESPPSVDDVLAKIEGQNVKLPTIPENNEITIVDKDDIKPQPTIEVKPPIEIKPLNVGSEF